MVQISLQQMDALCGNALELQNGNGLPVMAMSTQVRCALNNRARLKDLETARQNRGGVR